MIFKAQFFKQKFLPWLLVISLSSVNVLQACADSEKHSVHPDEAFEVTETERFSSENALEALNELEGSMGSFRTMTQDVRDEEIIILSEYEFTDWEIQNLGFENWILAVRGAIHHQNYQSHLLKYELALEKHKNGSGSEEELTRAHSELTEYKNIYGEFVANASVAD